MQTIDNTGAHPPKTPTRLDRWFVALERFNTIVVAAGLTLLLLGVSWAVLDLLRERLSATEKSVQAPGHSAAPIPGEKQGLTVRTLELNPQPATLVLELLGHQQGKGYESSRYHEVRNLLFLTPGEGQARWLFEDRQLVLARVEAVQDQQSPVQALLIETHVKDAASEVRDVYLVRPDGSGRTRVLEGIEKTLSRKKVGPELHLLYQRTDAVRLARHALPGLQQLSDQEVARLSPVR